MADTEKEPSELQEPSVLDYVLARLMPWRGPAPEIPAQLSSGVLPARETEPGEGDQVPRVRAADRLPLKSLGALGLALVGQFLLMPPLRQPLAGGFFFILAVGILVWAVISGELALPEPGSETASDDNFEIRLRPLLAGVLVLVLAFFAFSQNPQTGEFLYTGLNLLLWLAGIGLVLFSLWIPRLSLAEMLARVRSFLQRENWNFSISRHMVLVFLAFAVAVFFRVYRVGEVVPEMFSDQAEKLLDVYDVLQGHTKIFFERNTGREGLQFHLIAWTIRLFGTGISFLSMKIGTIFFGIFMLPYIYLLGREFGNKNVGLLAMLLTGVSYWPNILARVALRFILYPAFTAPTLYYLVRGLRTGKRYYFILSGIFLGIGLHGYSPFRVVPLLVLVVLLMYWLQHRERARFDRAFVWLGIVAFVSLTIFLPLLRVWTQAPERFNERMATRLTAVEAGAQMAQGWQLVGVFLKNVWNGLLMLNWDSGDIWVNTIVQSPSLEIVSGAGLILGLAMVIGRLFRHKRWEDGLLLWGIPILMLPSTLSLAYPHENPAPNRAGGAAVVVFILAAMGIEAVLRAVRQRSDDKFGLRLASILGVGLVLIAIGQNYTLTFHTFPSNYGLNAKNTSELGLVIAQFTDTVGSPDQAWVVAFPHWVDTRLVGINAGFPTTDFAIWEEDLETTLLVESPKLFLVKLDDYTGLEKLQSLYPEGAFRLYEAKFPEQSFFIYSVP